MFNITDFGAKPNLEILQTGVIQVAIDTCHSKGGGTVVIPKGKYYTSTLYLRSNVNLHLEFESYLIGSKNLCDYPEIDDTFIDAVGHTRGKCLIYAKNIKSSSITGAGTIDGNGSSFKYDEDNRPFLIRYINCYDICLQNISLKNSAAWVVHLLGTENARINGINIYSHANSNNDGIDIDSCNNIEISNCDIDTSDDAICVKSTDSKICENIRVYSCILKSIWGALKIGTETYGDIRNISFHDIKIRDTFGGGVKIISTDGCRLENVSIENISMENVSGPIFIRLGSRSRTYYKNQQVRVAGTLKNILLRNISIRVVEEGYYLYGKYPRKAGIIVTGIPGHSIENVIFENLNVIFPGNELSFERSFYNVPEQENEYPEFPMFHPLPSWAFFLRHVKGLTLKDTSLNTVKADSRPVIFTDDVKDLKVSNIVVNNQQFDFETEIISKRLP